MTLQELQTEFQVLVPEFPYSSYVAQVLRWLNTAQEVVAEKLLVEDEATADSEAAAGDYSLPDTCIEIKRDGVTYDGSHLDPANLGILIRDYGVDWKSTAAGTPVYFMREGTVLTLVPAPDVDDKEILVKFWGYPNALSASVDVPFTTGDETQGYDYHNALRSLDPLLLDYAVGMAKFALGAHATVEQALSLFYKNLAAKLALGKKKQHMEIRTKRPDEFMLRKIAARRNR